MSIHDLNLEYAGKGAKMLRGYDGYDNYYMLGTLPEFGAILAMRARNSSAGKHGTKIGFKLRLMPIPGAEFGNWKQAIPSIAWMATNTERWSACFGIGLAAWTREEVVLALKDVDYPAVLDNWLTTLGLTWDPKQRELLPAYLADAENALFADDYGDGVAPIDIEGRTAHAARMIVPEDEIWCVEGQADDAEVSDDGPDEGEEVSEEYGDTDEGED